ncbi:Branched-chain-amino-acid aminotransferase [Taphrina deformans PYCC 5710]|uniref:Branched-chain-amino-acid aminotransferase n=1 Tax=Taphrina deformans (strain PYCC 5710 / ATCC 11124 / CBS 356.35 / IMI 108563 / JCM 9778 / NBRC 8474) TaxID=1097556 RepID=R4X969_TAPDE|nr:Branched-chain-amino-acid aminotransferase [Taphrina deformans PYCC 5710]|eukprot:CCG82256.1 Branched-chain-amino-acid aminotransferase [Taphrina deformans PYCC 5710]
MLLSSSKGLLPRSLRAITPAVKGSRTLASLNAGNISIQKTDSPKTKSDKTTLKFGHEFSDHMLACEWDSTSGWAKPKITPYQPLALDPATCVFHYGFSCFEGMKAYKDKAGRVRLFRPDMNMARLHRSGLRIALPAFDQAELVKAIAEFVKVDRDWIPEGKGYSLYLRPTFIGTQKTLGIGPTGSALIYVIASPVGPYYPSGFKAVSLWATTEQVRAWPGGFGDAKLGGNYAPCVTAQTMAAAKGYEQNLWLHGKEHNVGEVGTSNLFVVWVNEEGEREIITAPLDGTILPGVTRDSILALARERLPEYRVTESLFTMSRVARAAEEGRLLEVFGAGTAVVTSPVKRIHYDGVDITVPLQEGKEAGPIAEKMVDWITAIQYGEEPSHPWTVVVE